MRDSFKKLLESVQKQCPDLITEEVFDGMMSEFDDGLAAVKQQAADEGQALGFREGYDEGKRVAAEQAKAEFDKLIEQLDAEAVEKLNAVIKAIDENHTVKLQELYDFMQNNLINKAELDKALIAQDEDYANKFETAVGAICEDHANKLQLFKEAIEAKHAKEIHTIKEDIDKKYSKLLEESIQSIDADNTAKLEEVVKLFKENKEAAVAKAKESVIAECTKKLENVKVLFESKIAKAEKALEDEKAHKLEVLAEGVEKYLNYALDQFKPAATVISEAKYNAAINTLDKVTNLLKVNGIIQEAKEGILNEYEAKLAESKAEQNKLINETIELKAQLDKQEAMLLLESKAQQCTPSEARFLRTYFKNATSKSVIEESIDTAHAAWKKIQSEHRQALQETVTAQVNKKPSNVVVEDKTEEQEPEKKVVSEQVESAKPEQNLVEFYAQVLKNK
jgi:hypothetical protein